MEEPYPYATLFPREVKKLYEAREAIDDREYMEAQRLLNNVLEDWEDRYDTRHEARED